MKIQDIQINESRTPDIIDNRDGLQAVYTERDAEYFGLRVLMRPSKFLELARRGDKGNTPYIVDHLENGGTIGSPYLYVEVPPHWVDPDYDYSSNGDEELNRVMRKNSKAEVVDHDGRHRMRAVYEVFGDVPIETHIFFEGGIKNRHIERFWIESMSEWLKAQDGDMVMRPFEDVL